MEKEIQLGLGKVGSVEADNVVILIFDPDPAHETCGLLTFLGLYIDDQAAELSQKFAPHKSEVVVFLLEIRVEHHHLSEAQGKEVQGVDPRHLAKHPTPESRLANERNVLRAVTHVEAAEKILVFYGSRVPRAVVLKVLQVGLNHGVHVTHLRHEQVFPLHHAIEYVVERNRGRGQRIRRSGCHRRCFRSARS